MDDKDEVDNSDLWEKANPMFSKPMSPYAEELFDTIMDEYMDLEDDPSGRSEFMAKRMNLPQEDNTVRVASGTISWPPTGPSLMKSYAVAPV